MQLAEVRKGGSDRIDMRRAGRDTANGGHGVIERRQRVLAAREQKEVHGRQEQQRTPLGERCASEERQQVVIVCDSATDGRVSGAAVTFDHRSEAPEVVGQRLLDEHGR